MTAPRLFHLAVPEERLAALRRKLAHVIWPDEPEGPPWATGTSLVALRDLVEDWRDGFDWRARARAFNRLPQFIAAVGGIDLHFVHQRGTGPAPMPLLLLHGWPSSVLDFQALIPLLSDPARHGGDAADAFTVVAPSLPGHTLSFRSGQRRLDLPETADVLARLMTEVLGYRRFGAGGRRLGRDPVRHAGAGGGRPGDRPASHHAAGSLGGAAGLARAGPLRRRARRLDARGGSPSLTWVSAYDAGNKPSKSSVTVGMYISSGFAIQHYCE